MRNLFNRLFDHARQTAAAFLVGLGIGSFLIGPAALALVFPGQYAPRYFPTQQVHYERHIINITATNFTADVAQNTCIFASSTCSLRFAALPYNAFILRGNWFQGTACNAVTTCTMSIGTASGGAQIVSAQDIKTAATGAPALTIVTAGQGAQVTGNNLASSGANGGFDLYVTVTFTGAAPSAGTIVFDLEYLGPNDGGCFHHVPIPTLANTVGPC
jgi:hypothetical protein